MADIQRVWVGRYQHEQAISDIGNLLSNIQIQAIRDNEGDCWITIPGQGAVTVEFVDDEG